MSEENPQSETTSKKTLAEWLLVIGLAFALTYVFFAPLWTGGGLIGGDLYTYFLPQKQFFAERLAEGEFPLWNNRSGYGYPLVAESQTGAFYPPHLALYSTLDVTTAYNLNQLLHYIATFVLVWLYAREVGVKSGGAILAALIYTYGWFPPRLCLEWAIIGGMYLPLQLWLVERFLKTSHWRYPIWMSVAGGTQLLAGHFNLAFIIDVVIVFYLPLRLWYATEGVAETTLASKPKTLGLTAAALALGFAVAAVQLVPTLELKQASQRTGDIEGGDFDAGYGHIPPLYLSQVFASWWWWYDPMLDLDGARDRAIQNLSLLAWSAGTNQVEAHLYFGLIPLFLVVAAAWRTTREQFLTRFHIAWFVLGLAALAYATGWLIPILQYVPGFTFFRGPGRYGIVTTLGMAIAAGGAMNIVLQGRSPSLRYGVLAGVFALTAFEFHFISRHVTYAYQLERTPIHNLGESPIRKLLAESGQPARLYAGDGNKPDLLGVSSVPEYLGLGPAEYYDPELKAKSFDDATTPELQREFAAWASEHGITHLLSEQPLPEQREWELRFAGYDPFLHPAMGRPGAYALFLYQRTGPAARAVLEYDGSQRQAEISRYEANQVEIKVDFTQPGRVVLRDLMFPGWEVTVDAEPAEAIRHERLFRAVDVTAGPHTVVWTYRPTSLRIGVWISAAAILVLLTAGHVRYWHFRPKRISK